jgi:toxin ParE1/3/4
MKRGIRRSKQSRQDIIEIYRFIHERSPQAAEKVFDAIERSVKSLLDMPGVGRFWNSPDPRLDQMRVTPVTPYRNYLIFFRATSAGIEIFRIIHGARELHPLIDDIEFDLEEQ